MKDYKGGTLKMILILILMTIAVLLTVVSFLGIVTLGTAGVIVFGDVIVCVLFIIWLVKKLFNRK